MATCRGIFTLWIQIAISWLDCDLVPCLGTFGPEKHPTTCDQSLSHGSRSSQVTTRSHDALLALITFGLRLGSENANEIEWNQNNAANAHHFMTIRYKMIQNMINDKMCVYDNFMIFLMFWRQHLVGKDLNLRFFFVCPVLRNQQNAQNRWFDEPHMRRIRQTKSVNNSEMKVPRIRNQHSTSKYDTRWMQTVFFLFQDCGGGLCSETLVQVV